jgi:hypothetical protein
MQIVRSHLFSFRSTAQFISSTDAEFLYLLTVYFRECTAFSASKPLVVVHGSCESVVGLCIVFVSCYCLLWIQQHDTMRSADAVALAWAARGVPERGFFTHWYTSACYCKLIQFFQPARLMETYILRKNSMQFHRMPRNKRFQCNAVRRSPNLGATQSSG